MNVRKLSVWFGGVGALLICIPVMYRIHEGDRFNPASYFLWVSLAALAAIVLIRQNKGGYMMMLGYVLSDGLIGGYAYLKSGRASFGWFEWFVAILVGICAAIYVRLEAREFRKPETERRYMSSIITNGIAATIAGVPVFVESVLDPYRMSYWICAAYLAVSASSWFGEGSRGGKFIPRLSTYYWIVLIGCLAVRRSLV